MTRADPYVEYERFDPETGEATGEKGMTLRSTVEWLIDQGEPVRITETLTLVFVEDSNE